jgi:hypothetical protein
MKTDLDRRLTERLGEVRARHGSEHQSDIPAIRERVLRRAGRRRALKGAGGMLVAAGLVVGILALPSALLERGVPVPPAGGPGTEELGFWPAVTRDEADSLCRPMDLTVAPAVASSFAGEMLGWSNVGVSDRRREENGIVLSLVNLPRDFAGGNIPQRSPVDIHLGRVSTSDCWWVTGIVDPRPEANINVSRREDAVDVAYGLVPGSVRADVLADEVGSSDQRYIVGRPGETEATIDGFNGPGYVLVVWKAEDGTTVSATGRTLP